MDASLRAAEMTTSALQAAAGAIHATVNLRAELISPGFGGPSEVWSYSAVSALVSRVPAADNEKPSSCIPFTLRIQRPITNLPFRLPRV